MINGAADLDFSPWFYWENRSEIVTSFPVTHFTPGVYCIAYSNKIRQGNPMTWDRVMYIGMSVRDKGLQGRWREFDSALDKRRGHSGGSYMVKDLRFERHGTAGWRVNGRKLLVSAMVFPMDKSLPYPEKMRKKGEIAYFEYEAFAQFATSRTRLTIPRFNNGGSARRMRGSLFSDIGEGEGAS